MAERAVKGTLLRAEVTREREREREGGREGDKREKERQMEGVRGGKKGGRKKTKTITENRKCQGGESTKARKTIELK